MKRQLFSSFVLMSLVAGSAHAASVMSDEELAKIYAESAVTSGETVGIGVAILRSGQEPKLFTYGDAVAPTNGLLAAPFSPDSLFEIGSVTKVFTTNLFAQYIADGKVDFNAKLASFQTQLGALRPLMSKVTLKQLGDFTGGIVDVPKVCNPKKKQKPTCLFPNVRPTIKQYNAQDFAAYFASVIPKNHQPLKFTPPGKSQKISSLPAPYFYSDFGLGLLGLLIASGDEPLSVDAFYGWYNQVSDNILVPLDMDNTYLTVPTAKLGQRALGYDQAWGIAIVENGRIERIRVPVAGTYGTTPEVQILDGGGKGAKAVARVKDFAVKKIKVSRSGRGYVEPPKIKFKKGGEAEPARARAVIHEGKLVGIFVSEEGVGFKRPPKVVIVGGREGGASARATAHLVNGKVGFVSVDDPGSGYVDPLRVLVAPNSGRTNPVPIWAPAGALKSSLSDMAKFAQSAMRNHFGHEDSNIDKAFRFAQRPYACTGPDPALEKCEALEGRSALAWAVQPRNDRTGLPAVISKNGALTGFTTQVNLMPEAGLAVVVFANSMGTDKNTGKSTGIAARAANNILYALYFGSKN